MQEYDYFPSTPYNRQYIPATPYTYNNSISNSTSNISDYKSKIIRSCVEDFARRIELYNISEGEFYKGIEYESFVDDIDSNQRILYFLYNGVSYCLIKPIPNDYQKKMDETTDRICRNLEYRIKNLEDTKHKIPIQKPSPLTCKVIQKNNPIKNLFNWLFPKCEYCEKRYARYLFKFHHNDIHICKRCCWIYEIDSKNKYETVDKIRSNIKKNINLTFISSEQIEENESISEKNGVVSH